ncbi:hypothetical protein T492DRAFT_884735, partial [Pavlovales sp. CCMP2436]
MRLEYGWAVRGVGGAAVSLRPSQEGDAYSAANIVISFSPVEMANLAKGVASPSLALSGRAIRPYCHFETKVIEFESLGVKRFQMVNPTSISYEYEWLPDN